jgi:hypothetical protein
MNDKNKHKQVTGQIKHQAADPKVNATVFLFLPMVHCLKKIIQPHKWHICKTTQANPPNNFCKRATFC